MNLKPGTMKNNHRKRRKKPDTAFSITLARVYMTDPNWLGSMFNVSYEKPYKGHKCIHIKIDNDRKE